MQNAKKKIDSKKWTIYIFILLLTIISAGGFSLNDLINDGLTLNTTGTQAGITIYSNISLDTNGYNIRSDMISIETDNLNFYVYNQSEKSFDYLPTFVSENITIKNGNAYIITDSLNLTEGINGLYDKESHLIEEAVNFTSSSNNQTKRIASSIQDNFNLTMYGFVDSCDNVDKPIYTSDTGTFNKTYLSTEIRCTDNILELNITGIELASTSNQLDIDSVAPNVTLVSPANNETDTDGIVTFQYQCSDTNLNNATLFVKPLATGGNFTNTTLITNTTLSHQVTGLSDGITYNWHVDCYDDLNNNGTIASRSISIDFGGGNGGGGGGGGGGGADISVGGDICEVTEDCATGLICDLEENKQGNFSESYKTCIANLCGNGLCGKDETFSTCKEDCSILSKKQPISTPLTRATGYIALGIIAVIFIYQPLKKNIKNIRFPKGLIKRNRRFKK